MNAKIAANWDLLVKRTVFLLTPLLFELSLLLGNAYCFKNDD